MLDLENWSVEEELFKEGEVRAIEFSGPTYQIAVFDKRQQEIFWTFFQFDEKANLKDAFCSCEENEICSHLAVGYFKIYNGKKDPLHIRFQKSFWNALAKISAQKIGYESSFLKRTQE